MELPGPLPPRTAPTPATDVLGEALARWADVHHTVDVTADGDSGTLRQVDERWGGLVRPLTSDPGAEIAPRR